MKKLRNTRINQRGQRGISILEVMIAMVILGVSLLLLLNMAMVALDGNDWSNRTTIATQLMQEKLEELRATGETLNSSDTAQGISRSWTVTDMGSHLIKIDVAVTWEDVRSKTKTSSMSAFVRTE
ncbi:MAG: prepilin-type N-terminal cleavage/methylation domain-containing protein [candidate division Zixibacteria bacterium]|nr:prepilin-type N-terminal cleavage/methylation domain-containing protein [candidate division Zixibacteria bacterium]